MNAEYLTRTAAALVRRYESRDPFYIAGALGIHVLYCPGFGPLKGMYTSSSATLILLNETLDERLSRIVCAHELGHDQLHRRLAGSRVLREFALFNDDSLREYEANMFAAALLLDDQAVLEAVYRDGFSAEQIAELLQTDINLVALKIDCLKSRGFDLRPFPTQRFSETPRQRCRLTKSAATTELAV